jgi:hypothetical protein
VRAKRLAQALGHGFIQGGWHHTTDVIGFENGGGDLHALRLTGAASARLILKNRL